MATYEPKRDETLWKPLINRCWHVLWTANWQCCEYCYQLPSIIHKHHAASQFRANDFARLHDSIDFFRYTADWLPRYRMSTCYQKWLCGLIFGGGGARNPGSFVPSPSSLPQSHICSRFPSPPLSRPNFKTAPRMSL